MIKKFLKWLLVVIVAVLVIDVVLMVYYGEVEWWHGNNPLQEILKG